MAGIGVGDHLRAPILAMTLDQWTCLDQTSTVATGFTELTVMFNQSMASSGNVLVDNTTRYFSFQKAGIWIVDFNVRIMFSTSTTTGDIYAYCKLFPAGGGSTVELFGETDASPISNTTGVLLSGYSIRKFNTDDVVSIIVRNATDQVATLKCFPSLSHLSFTWLQSA